MTTKVTHLRGTRERYIAPIIDATERSAHIWDVIIQFRDWMPQAGEYFIDKESAKRFAGTFTDDNSIYDIKLQQWI